MKQNYELVVNELKNHEDEVNNRVTKLNNWYKYQIVHQDRKLYRFKRYQEEIESLVIQYCEVDFDESTCKLTIT